jgi:hypothetical protein
VGGGETKWENENNPHLTEDQKAQVEATLKELEWRMTSML